MAKKALQKVEEKYAGIDGFDKYNNKKCQKWLLYPTTIINNTVLSVITGVATGLSINILTNFLGFDQTSDWGNFCLLLVQFCCAFAFNVSLIIFTVRCSAFKESLADINVTGNTKEKIEKERKKRILEKYDEEYSSIFASFVSSIVFFALVIAVVIVIPVILFVLGRFGIVA